MADETPLVDPRFIPDTMELVHFNVLFAHLFSVLSGSQSMSAFEISPCKHLTVSALIDSSFPAIKSTDNKPTPMVTSKTAGYIHALKYVLQNIHFLPVCTGMYSVHTRYILEGKSMYLVHTWGKKYVPGTYYILLHDTSTGLCWFIAVPCYSMVHTGSYSVHISMNSVHTTGHDSRCAHRL
jgi:hypothetical protein